ncbi:translation initiation factor IF-2-like [Marmota marmota marmota]|uniref:translation initiation factor IF-2-like n=1 Tax=Marmota marmota marmota TaxID=9994 RepID=UPI0020936C6D|nr:translation initiation factor IF-2-like [Marmota marmota marmota]
MVTPSPHEPPRRPPPSCPLPSTPSFRGGCFLARSPHGRVPASSCTRPAGPAGCWLCSFPNVEDAASERKLQAPEPRAPHPGHPLAGGHTPTAAPASLQGLQGPSQWLVAALAGEGDSPGSPGRPSGWAGDRSSGGAGAGSRLPGDAAAAAVAATSSGANCECRGGGGRELEASALGGGDRERKKTPGTGSAPLPFPQPSCSSADLAAGRSWREGGRGEQEERGTDAELRRGRARTPCASAGRSCTPSRAAQAERLMPVPKVPGVEDKARNQGIIYPEHRHHSSRHVQHWEIACSRSFCEESAGLRGIPEVDILSPPPWGSGPDLESPCTQDPLSVARGKPGEPGQGAPCPGCGGQLPST